MGTVLPDACIEEFDGEEVCVEVAGGLGVMCAGPRSGVRSRNLTTGRLRYNEGLN